MKKEKFIPGDFLKMFNAELPKRKVAKGYYYYQPIHTSVKGIMWSRGLAPCLKGMRFAKGTKHGCFQEYFEDYAKKKHRLFPEIRMRKELDMFKRGFFQPLPRQRYEFGINSLNSNSVNLIGGAGKDKVLPIRI